ncbi:MAG: PRC-barrel domain-containing protein [Nitrospira sp.]|nr:PRC-barrel domain-containing protein [Nitrospira sp.]
MAKGSGLRKRNSLILFLLVLVTMMTASVEARDKTAVLKASEIVGMKVEGIDAKNLGTIKDLVLDPVGGYIQYAVLDFGGVVGIKDKYFIVPWEAITFTPSGKGIVLDVSKRDLKNAPGFDKNHWPDFSDQRQQMLIYEFYEIPVTPREKLEGKE